MGTQTSASSMELVWGHLFGSSLILTGQGDKVEIMLVRGLYVFTPRQNRAGNLSSECEARVFLSGCSIQRERFIHVNNSFVDKVGSSFFPIKLNFQSLRRTLFLINDIILID